MSLRSFRRGGRQLNKIDKIVRKIVHSSDSEEGLKEDLKGMVSKGRFRCTEMSHNKLIKHLDKNKKNP